ncbi:hypothetical protein F5Y19DRAFT_339902 [Xylariaceae sp. FL1651]|nr:hypothetical protein F5Y19DRAFT_339902 [Xylariaceae sp. FL1651]
MSSTICSHCRLALKRTIRASRTPREQKLARSTVTATLTRPSRTQPSSPSPDTDSVDIASLLSRRTWSVRSLLPPDSASPASPTPGQQSAPVTPQTLHHLLRLSALPLPRSSDEEAQMLSTLSSQLHFVRSIQGVDTTGVSPLRVIRDETAHGLAEQTIGLAELRDALDMEDIVGHARRPRRRRREGQGQGLKQSQTMEQEGDVVKQETTQVKETQRDTRKQKQTHNEEEAWDVLGGASETTGGRYFVVRSSASSASPAGTVS